MHQRLVRWRPMRRRSCRVQATWCYARRTNGAWRRPLALADTACTAVIAVIAPRDLRDVRLARGVAAEPRGSRVGGATKRTRYEWLSGTDRAGLTTDRQVH